jgi:PEP-CTERM motif
MKLKRYAIRAFGALAASALIGATLAPFPASAAVTSIKTSSTVLDVALKLFGNPVDFGPVVPASGAAPPAYNVTDSAGSFGTSVPPFSFGTGVLVDTASGDTATAAGTASSSLASLSITADTFFTLTATAVSSTSSVDGTPSATGSSTLADLVITVLGSSINIPLNPSPNDVIVDSFGVKVTLNQQIHEVGGGSFAAGIITNAIAIDFSDSPEVTGFIDIAQSKASISEAAVPEPSTWAMMALGFVGFAFAYRRSRKIAAIC